MTEMGHSRHLNVGHESACPRIPDISGVLLIRRDVPQAAVSNRSKPTLYSITSSARAKNASGIVKPIAFAVLTLTASSNFVG
jgi:hypothetical protein